MRWGSVRSFNRMMRKLEEDRIRRAQQLRETDPEIDSLYTASVERLVAVGATALSGSRREVRAIGERLDAAGGKELMVGVLRHADALSQRRGRGRILRTVEMAWDGIGEWRG